MLLTREKLQLAKYVTSVKYPVLLLDKDRAVATDGHYLMIVEGAVTDPEEDFPDVGIEAGYTPEMDFVEPATARKVCNNLPKKNSIPILDYTLMNKRKGKLRFGLTDLENSMVITQRVREDAFPDIEPFLLKGDSKPVIKVDLSKLDSLVKAVREFVGPNKDLDIVEVHTYQEADECTGIYLKAERSDGQKMIALLLGLKPIEKD